MTAKGYREDLAYIHDVGFGHFANNAAPGLLEMLRQGSIRRDQGSISAPAGERGSSVPKNLIIDLGCGSGILARKLSDAGYRVLGVDQSEAMLDIARNRVPTEEFHRGSLLTAKLPRCAGVTAIGEAFSYLFDRRMLEAALPGLFRRIYDALVPGGLLIFDVVGPGRVPGPGPLRKYWEGEDWTALVETEEDRQRMILTRRITSFRRVGKLYRRTVEVHRLRLSTRLELAKQLRDCGFRVRSLRGYGQMRFPPGLFGFLARKP
jgi:SAM-dependent methyltransferase